MKNKKHSLPFSEMELLTIFEAFLAITEKKGIINRISEDMDIDEEELLKLRFNLDEYMNRDLP